MFFFFTLRRGTQYWYCYVCILRIYVIKAVWYWTEGRQGGKGGGAEKEEVGEGDGRKGAQGGNKGDR